MLPPTSASPPRRSAIPSSPKQPMVMADPMLIPAASVMPASAAPRLTAEPTTARLRPVDAHSEARIAYVTYRATYDIARSWRDRVLPLRQVVSKEIMLRYNTGALAGEGLRVDLFKYLADTGVRIAANAASLDARRDFLLAVADLQAALTIGGEAPNNVEPAGRCIFTPALTP
jgi:hypothetical protein